MPAWRDLAGKDLRDLVAFIQQPPTEANPASRHPLVVDKAESLFLLNCASCHGDQGDGRGPAAAALAPAPANFHLEQPTHVRALEVLADGVPGSAMPPWAGQLSESDRILLSKYVRSLAKEGLK